VSRVPPPPLLLLLLLLGQGGAKRREHLLVHMTAEGLLRARARGQSSRKGLEAGR